MCKEKLKPIKTSRGMLRIYRDWDNEGAIYMENAKTIKRYIELSNDQPDSDKYGIFWAFSEKQYEEGKERMKQLGFYLDGQKIYSFGMGGYGTSKEKIDAFFDYYKDRDKMVAKECDPQEVYFYEYNNFECMLDWEGDKRAYDKVVGIFGQDIAKTIRRI